MQNIQKLNAAESIRGLASLAVVFSHLSLSFFPGLHRFDQPTETIAWVDWMHNSPFAFWYSGTAAVFVFFVLSAYVLSFAIYKHQSNIIAKLKDMGYKRYPRLMIPVLSSCILTWLIFNSFQIDSRYTQAWLAEYLTQDIQFGQALYQGSIGSFFFGQSSVNWVLWTMQIEFFGSFLLFFLIYIGQRNQFLFRLFSIVLPIASYFIWGEGMLLGLSCFVIGLYIYRYGRRLHLAVALMMVIFALYLAGVHQSSASYQWLVAILGDKTYDYANFIAGVLLVYSIVMSAELSLWFDQKILVLLGKWSFSIYLLHLPLLYLVGVPLLNQLMDWQVDYTYTLLLSFVLYLSILFCCAAVFSQYIDQYAISISRKFAQRLNVI